MKLRLKDRVLTWQGRPWVMGIVNINDDSFSGDGTLDFEEAWGQIVRQVAAGADFIDLGAESARTNREAISVAEEVRRLRGVLALWASRTGELRPRFADQVWPPVLSLNTWRPEVVEAILPVGGELLNDLSGLPDDRNARLCAQHGCALVIMHNLGEPKVPHTHVRYQNVVEEVTTFFRQKRPLAEAAGLPPEALIFDPGLDFAKQKDDNLRLVRHLDQLTALERPVLLPLSRKTFIGQVLGLKNPVERDAGTLAVLAAGQARGAAILRMHRVDAAAEAVRVLHAIASA